MTRDQARLEELRMEERRANAEWHEQQKLCDKLSADWVHLSNQLSKAEKEAEIEAEVQRRLNQQAINAKGI